MSMLTGIPQTQIAIYLTKILQKRTDHVIESLPKHKDSNVHNANAGLEELHAILRKNCCSMTHCLYEKISNKFLQDWLWRFEDFFYMTEDVLDDLDFIVLPSDKPQGDDLSAFNQQMLIFMNEKLLEVINTAADLFRGIADFREARKEFHGLLFPLGIIFGSVRSRVPEEQQVTASSELPTLPYKVRELKGRAAEKAKILEAALFHKEEGESKDQSPVMILITGPVGIGKTDLARAVYNSPQVLEAEFDVRAWIYVANNPGADWQIADWWITLQRSESPSVDQPSNLNRISGSSVFDILVFLETEIKGKKVLIVLDNMAKAKWFYDDLFTYGAKVGSRIIVTSQSADIGEYIAVLLSVELDGLGEEEYLELFKECAFGDRNRNKYPGLEEEEYLELFKECTLGDRNRNKNQELEDIVGEIAKRFGGNPLAAVMIGRQMRSEPNKNN